MWNLIIRGFYTDFIKKLLFPVRVENIDIPRSRLMIKNNIHYIYQYKNQNVRLMIHQIKFSNNRSYIKMVGKELSKHIKDGIIIPVPQTKSRLRERGYDVTHSILKETKKHVDNKDGYGVVKNIRKDVQSQIKDKTKRIKSVRGTIKVTDINKIKGNTFIILDDVFTTGSTINEIKKAIEENGGKVSMCICVAH